jgi:hypothetical protein
MFSLYETSGREREREYHDMTVRVQHEFDEELVA